MGMSVTIDAASGADAEPILKLQYLCYQSEAETYANWSIEPLTESLDQLRERLAGRLVLVARLGEEVVGAVSGWTDESGTGHIERLCVHPRLHRHGLGGRLVRRLEEGLAAASARGESAPLVRYRLFTGHRSLGNLRLYQRLGYERTGIEEVDARLSFVIMEKPAPGSASAPAPAAAHAAVA